MSAVRMIRTAVSPGKRYGNWTFRKVSHQLLVSSLEASTMSGGTDVRPERATNATKGIHCHVSVKAIVNMAARGLPSHETGPRPTRSSAQLRTPKSRL